VAGLKTSKYRVITDSRRTDAGGRAGGLGKIFFLWIPMTRVHARVPAAPLCRRYRHSVVSALSQGCLTPHTGTILEDTMPASWHIILSPHDPDRLRFSTAPQPDAIRSPLETWPLNTNEALRPHCCRILLDGGSVPLRGCNVCTFL